MTCFSWEKEKKTNCEIINAYVASYPLTFSCQLSDNEIIRYILFMILEERERGGGERSIWYTCIHCMYMYSILSYCCHLYSSKHCCLTNLRPITLTLGLSHLYLSTSHYHNLYELYNIEGEDGKEEDWLTSIWWYQSILQKSLRVCGRGPWAAM